MARHGSFVAAISLASSVISDEGCCGDLMIKGVPLRTVHEDDFLN